MSNDRLEELAEMFAEEIANNYNPQIFWSMVEKKLAVKLANMPKVVYEPVDMEGFNDELEEIFNDFFSHSKASSIKGFKRSAGI